MKSDEYWRNRAIRAEDHINRLGTAALSSDILPLYQKALENINERIRRIFKKFSIDGQLTADEAKELLTAQEDAEELKKIRETLDDIQDPDLQRQARSRVNAPAYAARISREQAVGLAIQAEMAKVAGQQITAMEELLKPSYEYGKYRTIYDLAKGTGIGIDFTVMPVEAVQQALNDPWNGENFSKRVWDNTDLLAEKAKEIITSGIMSGESIGSMSVKLDETMKQGKYNAVRLVRTEANHYYNDGRLKGYRDSGIEQYRFLASLDLQTCKKCGILDGQKFDVDKAKPGKNYPPMHPNDRCTTVAVILINGKEASDGERFARNVEDVKIEYNPQSKASKWDIYSKGEYVPADMTWSQWYKEKVEGSEVAKLNKKKWDNRHADKKQHEKYRELLGKKVPKDFEKFQQIKYGKPGDDEESKLANAKRWKKIKSEYRAEKSFNSGNMDYMSNSFRPKFSSAKELSVGNLTINTKQVKNSKFDLYVDIGASDRNKAVRLTEKNMRAIQKELPDDFEMPPIAVVNFEKSGLIANAIGGYHYESGVLYINSEYDTNNKILDYVNKFEGQFANKTQYAPYLHELGHKYYYDRIKSLAKDKNIEYNKAKEIINDKIYDYIHDKNVDGSFLSKNISRYADEGYSSHNYSEIIAECFSVRGDNTASEILNLLKI